MSIDINSTLLIGMIEKLKDKNDRIFFIFPPFMFGNSDGKAKGYTLNYYYYYYYYYYISLKTRKKLLHFNKRFDSKI